MWAIIGGSGFEKFEGFKTIQDLDENTPFGKTSQGFKKVELEGEEILFIPRHGVNHDKLPTEVNYRANIYALKKHGATKLLAFSAVGSLANDMPPGDLVVPNQYIDRTKGIRDVSFFGEGIAGHCSLANPTTEVLSKELEKSASKFDFNCHFEKHMVIVEGPYFSTKAESHLYRSWNAHIIGMTSYPEYALAREAGLAFMPCCFVTDYDCWKDDIPHVTLEEVITIMRQNNGKAFEVAKHMVTCKEPTVINATEKDHGVKSGLMTPIEAIPADKKEWLAILSS